MKRNLKRGRPPEDAGSADYFERQTEKLQSIYNPVTVYRSDEGPDVLARKVARHALLEPYSTTNLNEIMQRYK